MDLVFRQKTLLAAPFGAFGAYDFVRAQLCAKPCSWPVMVDFMPWWAWLLIASIVLLLVVLEGAFRKIRALQRPLLSDARRILTERINSGEELQKSATELDKRDAELWFEDAMKDLDNVVGPQARKRFEDELPIARAYRNGIINYNRRHLVRDTKDNLKVLSDRLSDDDLYIPEISGAEVSQS